MGLHPRINNDRAFAAPMLVPGEGTDAIHICRGIGPGEGDPQKVVETRCRESGIITPNDQGCTLQLRDRFP